MNKLFAIPMIALLIMVSLGAGCQRGSKIPMTVPVDVPTWEDYTNGEFGFMFQYPGKYNLKEKDDDQTTSYAGVDMRFVMSLADPTRGEKEDPLVFVYWTDEYDIEQFKQANLDIYVNDEGIEYVEEVVVNQGGFELLRLVNTTAISNNKIHYIKEHDDGLLIFSVFLFEYQNFDKVFETLRAL